MDIKMHPVEEIRHGYVDLLLRHPFLLVAVGFLVTCLITRIRTGAQARRLQAEKGLSSRTIPVVPYWLPLAGHTIPFAWGFQSYLKKISDQTSNGIFALRIGGNIHNVVTSPSLMKELLTRPKLPISQDDFIVFVMRQVFHDQGATGKVMSTEEGTNAMLAGPHKVLSAMLREPFLSTATKKTASAVGDQAWNLVSGNSSWVDQAIWERVARVDVTPGPKGFTAEADLSPLLLDWVGQIASTLLMGHSFIDNNPNILADLWLMDSKFNQFLIPVPYWMIPALPPAHRARERVIAAVEEHHQAMFKILDGEDPGSRYDDMSDVPPLMWDRVKELRKVYPDLRSCACGNTAILWAMNVNANRIIFWLVFYLFSQPELLAAVRQEIGPYVQARQRDITGLPIPEAPKLDIDVEGLMHKCPLFKGAFFETMRLEVAATMYKAIEEDFDISESYEDAKILGKAQPDTWRLKKGQMLCIPPQIHQQSGEYFVNPEKFDARRFWNTSDKDDIRVEYKDMRTWGGGRSMCKGKNFAEREVLIFCAGVVMCWEMEPAKGKAWQHPGRENAAGANSPKHNVRVKMWRRTLG